MNQHSELIGTDTAIKQNTDPACESCTRYLTSDSIPAHKTQKQNVCMEFTAFYNIQISYIFQMCFS